MGWCLSLCQALLTHSYGLGPGLGIFVSGGHQPPKPARIRRGERERERACVCVCVKNECGREVKECDLHLQSNIYMGGSELGKLETGVSPALLLSTVNPSFWVAIVTFGGGEGECVCE